MRNGGGLFPIGSSKRRARKLFCEENEDGKEEGGRKREEGTVTGRERGTGAGTRRECVGRKWKQEEEEKLEKRKEKEEVFLPVSNWPSLCH
jgi:hypothetical protein